MEEPGWAPEGVDTSRASVARVYDYYLGGTHNFSVDRDLARSALTIEPRVRSVARTNRAFLGRAVRFLVDAGVRQFIDLGSGIPTQDNVHQMAQRSAPDARVVYVDNDPVAVAHGKAMLAGNDRAVAVRADMRRPDQVLDHPDLRALIDLDQPVGLLCFYVLHFVTDEEDPAAVVGHMRDAVASGSYLALSHIAREGHRDADANAGEQLYRRATLPIRVRTRAEIEPLFAGFDLVEPGLVFLPLWRPDAPGGAVDSPERSWSLGGVGREP